MSAADHGAGCRVPGTAQYLPCSLDNAHGPDLPASAVCAAFNVYGGRSKKICGDEFNDHARAARCGYMPARVPPMPGNGPPTSPCRRDA
jgi:hypothetical protein